MGLDRCFPLHVLQNKESIPISLLQLVHVINVGMIEGCEECKSSATFGI